jgi:hypothetical protein
MFKQFAFLFLLFVTYGCFIADEVINNKSDYSGSLSNRVKNAISKYVKDEYKDYQYYKYGFSDLIIHKPQELFKIDSLKSITPKSTQQKHQIQKSVDSLNATIKTNQIKYWLEMDHVFNIKNKITKKIELFEARFYLNDSIQVVRTKPLMFLELSQVEEVIYSDFFFETPIFYATTFTESQNLSHNFYSYFKIELETKKNISEKSNFLKHIIWICGEVKQKGEFKLDAILKKLTVKNFSENKEINNYKALAFSEVFEIKEDNILKNYYFFHKFSHSKTGTLVQDAVYITFSTYYELIGIYRLERPIEQYFNE